MCACILGARIFARLARKPKLGNSVCFLVKNIVQLNGIRTNDSCANANNVRVGHSFAYMSYGDWIKIAKFVKVDDFACRILKVVVGQLNGDEAGIVKNEPGIFIARIVFFRQHFRVFGNFAGNKVVMKYAAAGKRLHSGGVAHGIGNGLKNEGMRFSSFARGQNQRHVRSLRFHDMVNDLH